MELKELKEIIIDGDELQEIYKAHMELEERISELYVMLEEEEYREERIKLKAELTMANSLRKISLERQKNLNHKEVTRNYNFRLAARDVLTKKTYQVLIELANMPRAKVKEMKPDLIKYKLSE